jgi:hypothetical protein
MLDHRSVNFLSGKLFFLEADPYSNVQLMLFAMDYKKGNDSYFGGPGGEIARMSAFAAENTDCSLMIHGFRKRGHVEFDYGRGSWSDTVLMLVNPDLEPIVEAWCNGSEDAANSLEDHYRHLARLIKDAQGVRAADELLSTLNYYIESFVRGQNHSDPTNNTFFVLKPSDLENLLSGAGYKEAWAELARYGKREPLEQGIRDLKQTFKYLSY